MFPDGVAQALRAAGIDAEADGIDAATLGGLATEFGLPFLARLATSFRAEAAEALALLAAALAEGDPAAAERQFHYLKGGALYLALGQVARLCERLETEARGGRAHPPEVADRLRAEIEHGFALLARLGIRAGG